MSYVPENMHCFGCKCFSTKREKNIGSLGMKGHIGLTLWQLVCLANIIEPDNQNSTCLRLFWASVQNWMPRYFIFLFSLVDHMPCSLYYSWYASCDVIFVIHLSIETKLDAKVLDCLFQSVFFFDRNPMLFIVCSNFCFHNR